MINIALHYLLTQYLSDMYFVSASVYDFELEIVHQLFGKVWQKLAF